MGSSSGFSLLAKRLEGKVALITGGASGIGESTARLFSLNGAKVVIADIQDDRGRSVCSEISDSASFVHCDVTSESDVRNAVDFTVSIHGKLDIMYNNAGIYDRRPKSLINTDEDEFDRVIRVIVKGTFLGTKHAARVMIPAGQGCIISTASAASVLGGIATYAYTCAKHAVLGLTKNAAVELGQFGIRVNCVSPYALATPMVTRGQINAEVLEKAFSEHANLKGAVLKAEDVAQAVLYLGSDQSKYVSGHNLLVDGGYTIVNPSIRAIDTAAMLNS